MHVELIARADKYHREMRRANSATDSLRNGFQRLQSAVLLVTGATGFGIAVKRTFELGAAVEETGSKFATVFGESADEMDAFIGRWGSLAGLSRTQAREVTATTGAIVQGMGLAQAASAQYAEAVTRLAGDLSSFNNVPIAETSRAIQAAITGERESLKRLGIVILETDVQKRALIETGKRRAEQLTQEEKAIATLGLIAERAGVAIGDLDRTQDSAANRARRLGAEFRNIREAIASALLPVFEVFLREIENMIGGTATFLEWLKTSAPVMTAWAEVGVAAFRAVGEAVAAAFNITANFGQMFVATAGAMVAVVMRDWQTFHTLADEIEQSWVDMGDAFVGVGDRLVELYDKVRIAAAMFGETTVSFVRPALDSTTDGAEAAAAAVNRLVDALNKFNAASSLIGGLSRVPGLGFLASLSGILGTAGGVFNPLASLLKPRAHGGPVWPGQAYEVGERGRELFVPTQPGTIVPNHQLGGGGGGASASAPPVVNITFPRPSNAVERALYEHWVEHFEQAQHNGAVRLA
jgi:hypothetical protein